MNSDANVAGLNPIICPKCAQPNAGEATDCGKCGARLYVKCRKCGTSNPRVQTRCLKCGHRFRRSHRRSHRHHVHSDSKLKFLLVIGVILALYLIVRWLSAPSSFPALPPAEPPQ